jgi:homopolymeric O-antigen transport system permease protein
MSTSEQKDLVVEPLVPQKLPAQTPTIATIIKPARGWFSFELKEIWAYRELVYFLIWRDVKVRYKQTAMGAAWAVLQPVMTMIMFTLVFKGLAHVPSDGLPYSVFSYSALLPWTFFAGALARCSGSIVSQSNLISKIYFPRLIVPLASAVSGVVDFAISFLMLLALMIWYGISPTLGELLLPFFLLLILATALAVGLWLSAFNVKYRDVGQITPFLVQIWMFASPVAYSASMIPPKWKFLYSLNPMAGVIEGFRWALLGTQTPDFRVIAMSTTIVAALLLGGVVYFKRMERMFADII